MQVIILDLILLLLAQLFNLMMLLRPQYLKILVEMELALDKICI